MVCTLCWFEVVTWYNNQDDDTPKYVGQLWHPVAVAIYDFIGYIVDDVKKDVEFTQSFSKAKVDKFNST